MMHNEMEIDMNATFSDLLILMNKSVRISGLIKI